MRLRLLVVNNQPACTPLGQRSWLNHHFLFCFVLFDPDADEHLHNIGTDLSPFKPGTIHQRVKSHGPSLQFFLTYNMTLNVYFTCI